MAKGKRWYIYEDDFGRKYAVMLSKNVEPTGTKLGFTPMTSNDVPRLPQGMKMRYVNAVKVAGPGAGFIRRRFPCARRASVAFNSSISQRFTYDGVQYETTSKRGEKAQYATPYDTGI